MSFYFEAIAAAPAEGTSYLYAAGQGVMGCIGILLALNCRDSAYRVYSFFLNWGTIGPGRGFSPTIVRLTGGLLGVALIWASASKLLA